MDEVFNFAFSRLKRGNEKPKSSSNSYLASVNILGNYKTLDIQLYHLNHALNNKCIEPIQQEDFVSLPHMLLNY